MSLTARCGACKKTYKVDEKLAGKKVKCRQCGEVFAVPKVVAGVPLGTGSTARPAPAAAKPRVVKPAPAAAASEADPFGNLDALMSLEQSGTIDDAPPPPPIPAPAYAPPAGKRKGPIVEYVNEDGTTSRRPPVYAPRGGRGDYVSIPNEDGIDGFVPMISIGVLVLFLVITLFRGMSAATSADVGSKGAAAGVAFGILLGAFTVLLIVIFGILATLCMLGVFIASKIMKFERPGSFYLRCCAVVCAPISLGIVVNGFGFAEPSAVSWMVQVPVFYGVLWLMFRLRPLPYLITAVFVTVCVVGIPFIVLFLIASALNISFSGLAGAKQNAEMLKTSSNLRMVGNALMLYANENKGKLPASLEVLRNTTSISSEQLRSTRGVPFQYQYFPGLMDGTGAEYIVALDPVPWQKGQRICLFGDGRVEVLTPAEFDRAMQRSNDVRRMLQEKMQKDRMLNPIKGIMPGSDAGRDFEVFTRRAA